MAENDETDFLKSLLKKPDSQAQDQLEQANDNVFLKQILEGSYLTDQEKRVLEYRFGDELTLDETGVRLNLSGESIRQIQNKALSKMRDYLKRAKSQSSDTEE